MKPAAKGGGGGTVSPNPLIQKQVWPWQHRKTGMKHASPGEGSRHWGRPNPQSPKTSPATKKKFQKHYNFRECPKVNVISPKVNVISPKVNVISPIKYFQGCLNLKVLKFPVGGSRSQGFQKGISKISNIGHYIGHLVSI